MQPVLRVAAFAALLLVVTNASAQSVTYDFQDSTDQGFGTGFGNDASASFTIANVGGSLRMLVPRTGFQVAGRETGNPADGEYQSMAAAALNEAGYVLSYDYYIDTSNWGSGAGTYFQLGSYVNTGSGYYAQDFGATKEVELSGAQVASGQVFQGHVDVPFTVYKDGSGNDIPPNAVNPTPETFFRFGLIENGDGAAQAAYFDNVSIHPVPEPATIGLCGLALGGLAMRRRRRA